MSQLVVSGHLDLLNSQRQTAFASLRDLAEEQIWQRPAPKEWNIGWVNLITGLKVCIDHEQLHCDDIIALAASPEQATKALPISTVA